jgi:hypothetical protein
VIVFQKFLQGELRCGVIWVRKIDWDLLLPNGNPDMTNGKPEVCLDICFPITR